jgi:hypothetical protein
MYILHSYILSNSSETRKSSGPSNSRTTSNSREETRRGGTQAIAETLAGNSPKIAFKMVENSIKVPIKSWSDNHRNIGERFCQSNNRRPISYPFFWSSLFLCNRFDGMILENWSSGTWVLSTPPGRGVGGGDSGGGGRVTPGRDFLYWLPCTCMDA